MKRMSEISPLLLVEQKRLDFSKNVGGARKAQFGQFLTPATLARFMAELFPAQNDEICRLLDPGAGIGSLSGAFLERCAFGDLKFQRVEVTACELDSQLHGDLDATLSEYANRLPLSLRILGGDFIEMAVKRILLGRGGDFTHAILNPPYRKISNNSCDRLLLRKVGIETVNLYSAFLALTIALMAPGGRIVAIVPRSFCNGPYYRPFRDFLLGRAAIRRLHLFDSRNQAFKDDKVLQENIILTLECGCPQGNVAVSTSTDAGFSDFVERAYEFEQVVSPDDSECFIQVPSAPNVATIVSSPNIRYSLEEIGVQVSTGPVVDFRLKEHLRQNPEPGAIPLLYPGHFSGLKTNWPKSGSKKPNAIQRNRETEKWLYPNGFYTVVRRFSSKEEKRRIMATVVHPGTFPGVEVLGFENHLNVFHERKKGLPGVLAYGLALFLNTSAVDAIFRQFNGHTQVNATDLRRMKYPSRNALVELGEWGMRQSLLTESSIDETVKKITACRPITNE